MLKPFFMEPYFNVKDWGGTRLESVYGKSIPSDHTGESWEVSAHPMGLSACEGKTLPELIAEYGAKLTGTEVKGEFPRGVGRAGLRPRRAAGLWHRLRQRDTAQ